MNIGVSLDQVTSIGSNSMLEWSITYIIMITGISIINREHSIKALYTLVSPFRGDQIVLLLIEVGLWLIIKGMDWIGVLPEMGEMEGNVNNNICRSDSDIIYICAPSHGGNNK